MGSTVKGSARKGVRLTHSPKAIPGGASSPDGADEGGSSGMGGASNVNGSGNGGAGDLKSGSGFPASGSGRNPDQVSG